MMFKLTSCAAALAGSLMFSAVAVAQEPTPTHLAAARELIQITGVLQSVNDLLPTFSEQIRRQSVTRPDLAKPLDEVLKNLEPELGLQRQQIVTRAAQAYAKFLTEAEIKDALAFFKTPSGAKFAKVQPDLTDDLLNRVQLWSQEVSEYVMVRTRAEMAKRGYSLQ